MNRLSEVTVPRFSHDALSGEANEEAQRKRSSVLLAWRMLTCSRLVSTNSRVGLNHGASGNYCPSTELQRGIGAGTIADDLTLSPATANYAN